MGKTFHERHRLIELEPILHVLAQMEGAKAGSLATFDLGVEQVFGVCPSRVHDDAPSAKGSGAKLRPTVEPADDFSIHDRVGDDVIELGIRL